MKKYEKKKIERDVIVSHTCDMCGLDMREVNNKGEDYIQIRHEHEDYNYGDCGSGKNIEVDICVKCFTDKILPFLRQAGVTVPYQDWEY